jgi:signal transduction histidine kinase
MLPISLRARILFPVAGMILLVVLASLAVINFAVRRQVFATVATDLSRSRRVFDELQQRRLELLIERSLVVAHAPYLKAAVETGDSSTVQPVAEEVYRTVRSDLLVITDRDGRVLAQVGGSTRLRGRFTPDSLRYRGTLVDTDVGLLPLGDSLYRVVVVPIVSEDPAMGVYLLGTAAFGSRIDLAYLRYFRALTNSEIAFLVGDRIFESTLPGLKAYDRWIWGTADAAETAVQTVTVGTAEYIASPPQATRLPGGSYALLRAVDEVLDPLLVPIERAVAGVAVLAIFAAIGLSYLLARSVVTPVQRLVRATDAVSGGDYDHPIAVETRDEIGHLARKFDEMRQSLKRQMAQLGQRNEELEAALRKLERTQAELVQSEKLAATGKITAQLSHELNNPIHNIRSCLEAAQKKLPPESPGREFLDLAHEEVLRISKLVRKMLDFYRPETTEREPVSVTQIAREILKSSGDLLRQRSIDCRIDLPDRLPPISASPDQLKQVFLNLLLNAIDAMPEGGKLTVHAGQQDGWVWVSIADTGIGIPPEHLDRIFDAFFTTKSKASGVGLGLSVSYGIVRSHGGRIEVESAPGKGARFVVKLPVG